MKRKWQQLVIAALCILTTRMVAHAGDWIPRRYKNSRSQPVRQRTAPPSWSQPATVPVPVPRPAPQTAADYGVALGKPVARKRTITPVHYQSDPLAASGGWNQPRYRAQGGDDPKPMPPADLPPPTRVTPPTQPELRGPTLFPPPTQPTFPGTAVAGSPIIGAPVVAAPTISGAPIAVGPGVPMGAGGQCGECWWGDPGAVNPGVPEASAAMANGVDQFQNPFHNRWELSAEYLRWWIKQDDLPPLATVGAPGLANAGILGQGGTQTVLGGGDFGRDSFDGGLFKLGWWLDPNHIFGVEGTFLFLQESTTSQRVMSNGAPVLGVPFFDLANGVESLFTVAGPGRQGNIQATMTTRMWGAEANFKTNYLIGPRSKLDLFAGFRSLGLEESLSLQTHTVTTAAPMTMSMLTDHFATRNRFYGGQVGANAEFYLGRWSLDITGKVGVGSTRQSVDINGFTTTQTAGAMAMSSPVGLFAQPSTQGLFSRYQTSVVSELGIKLGWQVFDCMRATVGYNLLYWTGVARPGGQIDRVLNQPNPAMGELRPQPRFADRDFWAQGISLGLEFRY